MKRLRSILATAALGLVLGLAAAVHAEAIQKWRTPSGTLYFGDRPPPGSVLLETFPDSSPTVVAVAAVDGLAQAAAEGREIIKRREAERSAVRKEEAELALRETAEEAERQTFVIVNAGRSCAFGEPCFFDRRSHHRRHCHQDDSCQRQLPPVERPIASPPAPFVPHSASLFLPRQPTRSAAKASPATFHKSDPAALREPTP